MDDHVEQPAYLSWENGGKSLSDVLKETSDNLHEYGVARASHSRSFRDIEPNLSSRMEFSRRDYDFFRPGEAVPDDQKKAIGACMRAYERVGLIRNVIDLMGDFACQGIKLVHPQPRVQKFYEHWFEKVQGQDRSERFLNLLYRSGNVVVKRQTAKLKLKDQRRLQKTAAAPDIESIPEPPKVSKREIPWTYHFLSPLTIEVRGGDLASISGKPRYGLKISARLRNKINYPRTADEREMVKNLPEAIRKAAKQGADIVPLDPDKISVFHYKKDDWSPWASPMTYAILDDVIQLEKTKLADIAALDGIISSVRLWRLGSMEHKIMPTRAAINKLSNILINNVGGGAMDLVWGPDLEFVESSSTAHQFLGEAKYAPVLNAIYAGLGIPPTLTGSATQSGFTNNFISLKTLTERLAYGRSVLVAFWNAEIAMVQKAMGFRTPAKLQFDRMTLSDEAAEKALLIQLWDRDIISDESILERFGEFSDLEQIRIMREKKERDKGERAIKASPWHNPLFKEDLIKLFVSGGSITPSEVDVELKPRKAGEKSALDFQAETEKARLSAKVQQQKQRGRPGQGRPKTSKDSTKRKTKRVKPVGASLLSLWTTSAYHKIAEVVTAGMLSHFGKKNLRMLTTAEFDLVEQIKFSVLCYLEPMSEVTPVAILNILNKHGSVVPKEALAIEKSVRAEFVNHVGREPSVEDLRQIQVLVYQIMHNELMETDDNG